MPRSFGLTTLRMTSSTRGDVLIADLEARAAGHAHVDDELAGIGARKIGAAEEGKQAEQDHCQATEKNSSGHRRTPQDAEGKLLVAVEEAVEVRVEDDQECARKSTAYVLRQQSMSPSCCSPCGSRRMNLAQKSGTTVMAKK